MLQGRHPVFDSPLVGLIVWLVMIDVLHTLDLGICQHIGGSIFYLLAFDADLPGNLTDRLNSLWLHCCKAYDALGTPAGERLSHPQFFGIWDKSKSYLPTKYPVLHSKGAVGRHAMAMLKLVLRRLGPRTEPFEHSRALLEGLCKFYDVIMTADMWLTPGEARDASEGLLEAGVHHQALCHLHETAGRQLFYMTEKAHYAQHIGLDLLESGFNPRFGWTYGDEDFMGRIAQVAKPCLRGRGPLRVGAALFFFAGASAFTCGGNASWTDVDLANTRKQTNDICNTSGPGSL